MDNVTLAIWDTAVSLKESGQSTLVVRRNGPGWDGLSLLTIAIEDDMPTMTEQHARDLDEIV